MRLQATIPASSRVNIVRSAERIAELYDNVNRPGKSAEWRAKVEALRRDDQND